MKKNTFLLLFILMSHFSFSQISFIQEIEDENNLYSAVMKQLDNGNYIVAGFTYEHVDTVYTSKDPVLFKLDSMGEILKIHKDRKIDSLWMILDAKLDNNNIITLEAITSKENLFETYIYLSKYDEDLNLLERKKYDFPVDSAKIGFLYFREYNNNFLIYGRYYSKPNSYDGSVFLWKISQDTTIYKEYDYIIYDLQILDDTFFYYLSIIHELGITVHKARQDNLEIVNTFHVKDLFPLPNQLNSVVYTYFEIIKKHLYLFTLGSVETENYNNNNFTKFDTALNVIENKRIETENFDERNAWVDGLDQKNNYLFALNSNMSYVNFEITKLDTNFNVLFQKFINTEDFSYIYSVTGTNDGGCIVLVISFTDKAKIRLYKFDADGNLPVNIEDEYLKISNYAIYPNPTSNILKIKKAVQVKQADFVLYDTDGQVIMQERLLENNTKIDVSHLPKGIYLYNIFENNTLSDEGKIIISD